MRTTITIIPNIVQQFNNTTELRRSLTQQTDGNTDIVNLFEEFLIFETMQTF